jgi:redox-sensitive bicupin YhaK (pirin superfamily)
MKCTIHKANSRGYFDHGWLRTNHTFSFGHYYNEERINFGKLRVLNDDIIAPGQGFGTHPHNDMEIISIPLKGALAHKDSAGNEKVILPNDIQVMSAGTGIQHSEYNHSTEEEVNFLQLWIMPNKKGHQARYDQKTFDPKERTNSFQNLVAPKARNDSLWINQDAYLSMSDIDESKKVTYKINIKENGIYIFLIEGKITVGSENLSKRDGIGIWETDEISLTANEKSQVLLIEVPMN